MNDFVMKSEDAIAQIQCTGNLHIQFSQSQCIHITRLEFIGCGGNQIKHVEEFVAHEVKFKNQRNSGTALELIGTTAKIINSTFISNESCVIFDAENSCNRDGFVGGALIATNSTINIIQNRFEGYEANFGGAIFAEQRSTIEMSGNAFVNNNAIHHGGVLYSNSSTVTIRASEFHENNAARWGGVMYSYSSIITIEANKFHFNSANWGGALDSYNSTITIEASEFHNNSATRGGGVLYSSSDTITIEASEFNDNSARWGGVISYNSFSTITLKASKFYNNSAINSGGVLYSSSSAITIEASEFHNSRARWGGVLISYNSTSIITLKANKFYNNSANSSGGVMDSNNCTIIVEANEFHNNSATWGGVLDSSSSNITINASEFRDNSATWGGVLDSSSSNITINANEFRDNSATCECKFDYSGSVLDSSSSTITIKECEFHDNSGGVVDSYSSTITIEECKFHDNSGGVVDSSSSTTITIKDCEFHDNSGRVVDSSSSTTITIKECEFRDNSGGVLGSSYSTVTIEESEFHKNIAVGDGGVLWSSKSTIVIEESEFYDNSATNRGGVLADIYNSNITIEASEFNNNSATAFGGVLYSITSTISIASSNFSENISPIGAVIYATSSSKIRHKHKTLIIYNNSADRYAVIYLSNSEFMGYDSENVVKFSNNLGSLVAFNSNITFIGHAIFMNNQPPRATSGDLQEGGAITLFQSNVIFDGECHLEYNNAENGGAIHSTESKLYVNGNATIAHNTATQNGGGVYLLTSELNCQQKSTFVLYNNTAVNKGGGLHAISSFIRATSAYIFTYTGARINITGNAARMGGGLSLEVSTKFYVLKYDVVSSFYVYDDDTNTTMFTDNSADYGGAIYVDDDTISGTCTSDPKIDCFFQILAIFSDEHEYIKTQSIHFSQNYAKISGSTLYGGLLDRCAVSQLAEIHKKYPNYDYEDGGDGILYFKNASTPVVFSYELNKEISINTSLSVSSLPVQVCSCISNKVDCTHKNIIEIKKGEAFTHSVVAVDQIGQPVSAIIQTSLNFTKSGVAEGQLARRIPAECADLIFNIVSPHNSERLTLYALDGPCKDAELSTATVKLHFLPCSCPIGLQVSGMNSINCECECHSDINEYMEQCDSHTGSLVKQPQSRAWISYFNITDLTGYLVYRNCPFDYCLLTSPPVDLNQPNGADAQCAFNRSSLLCGSCQPGLSLSLGSSRCLLCPSYWPALLITITIATILAGIALVTLLLVLNMTVAVGTFNGLIFYVNIVHANKSILLPFQKTDFITVIVSWLNLELGIDTCYFPGVNTYIKIWLQLAFPAYVILLVVLVIIISSYSSKFSNLIGKKNPVATLATLILLSYATLLETCFKSLSVGILKYPDGSNEMLWLPDATVQYLSGKHIPLFIATTLILLLGLVYTALLFSWQWLLHLPRWRIFKWSRNPKIKTFIETYHTPYTPKHRYWTGLLLIVRIILYLVAATNVSNNPTVALTAINFTVCCIFALRQFIGSRIYRKWPVNILDTFFYLNILSFAVFTWYSLDNPDSNQEAAAYTSVVLTLFALLLIILYHIYTYTTIFSKVAVKTKLGKMMDRMFTDTDYDDPKSKPERHWSPPPDDDIHRFNELLDMIDHPVDTNDYKVKQKSVKPTQSVVEVHQSKLAPSDPEEVINTQHFITPGAIETAQPKEKGAVSQL